MNIAFFDVDETVIDCKSMFVFAKYYLDEDMKGRYGISFATLMEQIHRKVEDGASRETVNRFYYETFAGHSQREVREAARALYAAQPYPLRPNTVERLREHQRAALEHPGRTARSVGRDGHHRAGVHESPHLHHRPCSPS